MATPDDLVAIYGSSPNAAPLGHSFLTHLEGRGRSMARKTSSMRGREPVRCASVVHGTNSQFGYAATAAPIHVACISPTRQSNSSSEEDVELPTVLPQSFSSVRSSVGWAWGHKPLVSAPLARLAPRASTQQEDDLFEMELGDPSGEVQHPSTRSLRPSTSPSTRASVWEKNWSTPSSSSTTTLLSPVIAPSHRTSEVADVP